MAEETEITGSMFLSNMRMREAIAADSYPRTTEKSEVVQYIKYEQMRELVAELTAMRNTINLEKTKALSDIDDKYKPTIESLEFQYASILSLYS